MQTNVDYQEESIWIGKVRGVDRFQMVVEKKKRWKQSIYNCSIELEEEEEEEEKERGL